MRRYQVEIKPDGSGTRVVDRACLVITANSQDEADYIADMLAFRLAEPGCAPLAVDSVTELAI